MGMLFPDGCVCAINPQEKRRFRQGSGTGFASFAASLGISPPVAQSQRMAPRGNPTVARKGGGTQKSKCNCSFGMVHEIFASVRPQHPPSSAGGMEARDAQPKSWRFMSMVSCVAICVLNSCHLGSTFDDDRVASNTATNIKTHQRHHDQAHHENIFQVFASDGKCCVQPVFFRAKHAAVVGGSHWGTFRWMHEPGRHDDGGNGGNGSMCDSTGGSTSLGSKRRPARDGLD